QLALRVEAARLLDEPDAVDRQFLDPVHVRCRRLTFEPHEAAIKVEAPYEPGGVQAQGPREILCRLPRGVKQSRIDIDRVHLHAHKQMAFGEKKLAAVESRLAEIKQLATELDKSIAAIAAREQLVNAVKAEVENVHTISARS